MISQMIKAKSSNVELQSKMFIPEALENALKLSAYWIVY